MRLKNIFKDFFEDSIFSYKGKKKYFGSEYISEITTKCTSNNNNNNEIFINGEEIELKSNNNNIKIKNDKVYINGEEIELKDSKSINIIINGNVEKVNCAGDIEINGDCDSIKSENGDIEINGNVSGNVSSNNGDIDVEGDIKGNVSTQNGDIIS